MNTEPLNIKQLKDLRTKLYAKEKEKEKKTEKSLKDTQELKEEGLENEEEMDMSP